MTDVPPPRVSYRSLTPRVLSSVLLLFWGAVAAAVWSLPGGPLFLASLVVPTILFARSFCIRLALKGRTLHVVTWIQTREFSLTADDHILLEPYSGAWNRYAGVDGWLNINQYMLTLSDSRGRMKPLPSTIGSRGKLKCVAAALNEAIEAV